MDRIAKDSIFAAVDPRHDAVIDPNPLVRRAPQRVDEFIAAEVDPIVKERKELLDGLKIPIEPRRHLLIYSYDTTSVAV